MNKAYLLLPLLSVACAGRAPSSEGAPDATGPARDEAAIVTEARTLFPRTLDMHQKIVARSCAPNTGVCHNTSNYPDLSTPSSMLQAVGSWCNLEIPDPTQGYDLCERRGDFVYIDDGAAGIVTEIAFIERLALDDWRIGLRDAVDAGVTDAPIYLYAQVPDVPVLQPAADWQVVANVAPGSSELSLQVRGVAENPFIQTYIDEVLASVVGGDQNRNGTFGADVRAEAEDAAKVIEPGSLTRSYLWGRITGTVPGSRMPLANEALTDAEYVAMACFIETLEARGANITPNDDIDYDNCDFAKDPPSLALTQ
jgi:hypothetical protein